MRRFPGISYAYVDETGKETTEYYGVSGRKRENVSWIFRQLRHVESAVRDAQRKKTANVKVASSQMDIARNGSDPVVARSTNVQGRIMYGFADYAPNFLVNGWFKKFSGEKMS